MERQSPDYELLAAAMHGNCVFSDAETPANVQHLSGRAVVNGTEGREGKIHFPLGLMVDSGTVSVSRNSKYEPGLWLQVDCSQVESQERGEQPSCTEVVKAEVFVGCLCIWSKDFSIKELDPPKTSTFRERLSYSGIYQACMADGPKGLEVTLTLKFGQDSMRFCSVAVFDVVSQNPQKRLLGA